MTRTGMHKYVQPTLKFKCSVKKKRAEGNDIARLLKKIRKTGENVNFAF